MYATERDVTKELRILKALQGMIGELQGMYYRKNPSGVAIYDFTILDAYKDKWGCLEVKIKEKKDNFKSAIISVEKIDHLYECTGRHFFVYYVVSENAIEIFWLERIQLQKKTITIWHKRALERKTQQVYVFKRNQHLYRFENIAIEF